MDKNCFLLVGYAFFWLVLLLVHQLRTKTVNVGTFLLGIYSASSLSSIYFYLQIEEFAKYHFSLWAFVYLGGCILVCSLPALVYANKLRECKFMTNNLLVMKIFLMAAAPFVLLCFAEVTRIAMFMKVGSLADAYEITSRDVVAEQMTAIGARSLSVVRYLTYIWPILIFYCLLSKEKTIKWLTIVPLLAFGAMLLAGYAGGRRITMVRLLMYFFVAYLLFYPSIEKKFRQILNRVLVVGVSMLVVLMAFITISRMNNQRIDFDVMTFVTLYSGEGEIRFAQYTWNLDRTSDGDTGFAMVKEALGLHTYTDVDMRRHVYHGKFGIPTFIFYTFIGDWYQDFGPYYTVLLCLLFSLICCLIIRRAVHLQSFPLSSLILLSIALLVVAIGFTFYTFKTYNDQKLLLYSLIWVAAYAFFEYVETFQAEEE